ncbi:hypothetical protein [Xanthomonas arboricola]|uniref:Uncharacterized protein n=1 Tax=Xanthomonas arboricola TaxID=56448 RepID=A0AB73GXD3_9XANT|nr:hypothetical protein [Xanthomonas arboricola]MBB5670672.1 hypothetical protein [Xanthomonas arboricola]
MSIAIGKTAHYPCARVQNVATLYTTPLLEPVAASHRRSGNE